METSVNNPRPARLQLQGCKKSLLEETAASQINEIAIPLNHLSLTLTIVANLAGF